MARRLPEEAYRLSAKYHLGTPQKRYLWRSPIPVLLLFDGCVLIVCLVFIGQVLSVAHPDLFLAVAIKEDLSSFLLFLLYLLLLFLFHLPAWASYAYECREGFIEVSRITGAVTRIIRWEKVRSAYLLKPQRGVGRTWVFRNVYYVTTALGEEVAVPYWGIWRSCRKVCKRASQEEYTSRLQSLTNERHPRQQKSQERRMRSHRQHRKSRSR